jgi:HK97 family phage prohead protease
MIFKNTSKKAVTDVDMQGRVVTGYFATWGRPADADPTHPYFIDSDGDVFDPKAFDVTIAQNGPQGANRIWHLQDHSFSRPVNKPSVLKADNFGVYYETFFPDTTIANDLLKLYEAGAITEHSVMFQTIDAIETTEAGQQFNLIKQVRMWEGSSVLWGANSNTPTMGIKAQQAAFQVGILDNILHNGTLSDEMFVLIEKMYNDLKDLVGSGKNKPAITIPAPDKTEQISKLTNVFNENFYNKWKRV